MSEFVSSLFGNIVSDLLFAIIAFVLGILFSRYKGKVSSITKGKPTISPDGKSVVYESEGNIHVTDPQNGLHNLVGGHNNRYPIWSQDSKYLAFSAYREKNWDVFVVDLSTRKVIRLTTSPGPERPIGWNENGALLINMGGSSLFVHREEIEKRLKDG